MAHSLVLPSGFRSGTRENEGFTLAELLIALVILGLIATFTIPKVLATQQNRAWNAEAKEAAAAITEAYAMYKRDNGPTTTMYSNQMIHYLNYVKLKTSGSIDHVQGLGSFGCDAVDPCYILHNGAAVRAGGTYFGGTASKNFVHFLFDPDGQYSGNTSGPGKSMTIDLHYSGRVNFGVERGAADETWNGAPQVWGPDATPEWYTGWT